MRSNKPAIPRVQSHYGFYKIGLLLGICTFCYLGLFLAIPPGFKTPIWPATGVLLALFFLRARYIWPVAFLAVLLLHLLFPARPALDIHTLILVLCLTSIHCAHAYVAAQLLRKHRVNNTLEDPADIVCVLLLAGIVSCVFSASLSSALLFSFEYIAASDMLFCGFVSWVGSCLGIFVFTPLIFILNNPTDAVSIARKRSVSITLILLYTACFFISALLFHYALSAGDSAVVWIALLGLVILTGLISMIVLLITSQNDMVKRKVNEQSRHILAREAQLRTFVYYTPAAIAMVDRDLRYILTSAQWLDDFALKDQDIIGRAHYDIFPTLKHDVRWLDAAARALKGEVAITEEQIWEQESGAKHSIITTLHPWRDATDAIAGIIIFSEDISSQKRELAAKQALINKLAASNQDLERYAYICSHDLQEPLRTISNYVQRLERSMPDLNDVHRLYLKYLRDNAARARMLIQGLLDYSRIGHTSDTNEICDTEAIAHAVCQQIESSINASGAQIIIGALPSIYAPASLLQQLFLNLFVNAIKFRHKNISPIIHVSAETLADRHCFYVRDNGIGIAAEHQERIFAIFQRLHNNDEYPGMGIGLAICRRIADYLGGEIRVTSIEGQGAQFIFTIPITKHD